MVRTELGLAKTDQPLPQEGDLPGHLQPLRQRPAEARRGARRPVSLVPDWADELERLFDAYVDRKEAAAVLDYDDLLLYWHALLGDPQAGPAVRRQFDCVLVDEYQDTNAPAGRDPVPAFARRARD